MPVKLIMIKAIPIYTPLMDNNANVYRIKKKQDFAPNTKRFFYIL